MKTRHWNIQTSRKRYHLQYDKMGLWLDGRKIDVPIEYFRENVSYKKDFRLPIDEADCRCKFDRKTQFLELYVNGGLIPDVDNTQKPKYSSATIVPIVCLVLAILLVLLTK